MSKPGPVGRGWPSKSMATPTLMPVLMAALPNCRCSLSSAVFANFGLPVTSFALLPATKVPVLLMVVPKNRL